MVSNGMSSVFGFKKSFSELNNAELLFLVASELLLSD